MRCDARMNNRRRTADRDALVRRRDELQAEHEAAVIKLETEGLDRAHVNRPECNRLYDELAAVQREIDAMLERERRR